MSRHDHWKREFARMLKDVDQSRGEVGTHEAVVQLLVDAEATGARESMDKAVDMTQEAPTIGRARVALLHLRAGLAAKRDDHAG